MIKRNKKFTILELLIALVILLALAALLLPMLSKVRERTKEVKCVSNRKQIFIGLVEFIKNNDNHFPSASNYGDKTNYKFSYFSQMKGHLHLMGKVTPYTEPEDKLICPSDISNTTYWGLPFDEPTPDIWHWRNNHRRWMSYNGTLWSGKNQQTTPKLEATNEKAIFGDLILRASLLGKDHVRKVKPMAFIDGAVRLLDQQTLDMDDLPHWPNNTRYKEFWDNLNEQF